MKSIAGNTADITALPARRRSSILTKFRHLLWSVLCAAILLVCVITTYAVVWSFWYSRPATPAKQIDLRVNKQERPYYLMFCASLADNPLGFPGHCYVVWTARPDQNLLTADSAAFMPAKYLDQVPSLWTHVRGIVYSKAAVGNMKNLDRLIIIVDSGRFQRAHNLALAWSPEQFQAGVRDCVSFTDYIARGIGLKTPACSYTYPQDYVRELKSMN